MTITIMMAYQIHMITTMLAVPIGNRRKSTCQICAMTKMIMMREWCRTQSNSKRSESSILNASWTLWANATWYSLKIKFYAMTINKSNIRPQGQLWMLIMPNLCKNVTQHHNNIIINTIIYHCIDRYKQTARSKNDATTTQSAHKNRNTTCQLQRVVTPS